ncbi:MAG: YggS family pyridoxal phosphate-dependent enzyme [Flavobacteriales bacterium]|nr:YggS family pyridoxal phosphate-dependent enzyme [Flavobacteriales bacterium]
MSISDNLKTLREQIPNYVELVAVSKTKQNEDILEAYNASQRIFGENKIQELAEKQEALPKDIEWHFIGHLQTNKVKYIAPFVSLIHAVDSFKLLQEIDKRAKQNNRTIDCLLQVKIAIEESKFGLSPDEIEEFLLLEATQKLTNIRIVGLMGMATNTLDEAQIKNEFNSLSLFFNKLKNSNPSFQILSMGMSGDFQLAMEQGSNMIRLGSSIFGARNYSTPSS